MVRGLKPHRAPEALDLESHRAGHALLVNPKGALNQQAVAFAQGLPRDPEHHLVVLDLPRDTTDATWAVLARLLGRRTGNYRLVLGRRLLGSVVPVGQWLADRLDRAVVVPDGVVVPAADGVLYIPAEGGSGWVRLQPRRPATHISRRFPKPTWEFTITDHAWRTSELVMVDSLPSGVWLRGTGPEPPLVHGNRLVSRLACQQDLLTVVLGCPGTAALPLDDVHRFWESVQPGARPLVRFVQYGPLAVPETSDAGQVLADRLDFPVVFYNGLPVSRSAWEAPQIHALDGEGALGWAPYARELCYTPSRESGGRPGAPSVLSHRSVADGIPQIAPGLYQYADDAVLEVVPSGVWMRPPEEPAEAFIIRSTPPDPRQVHVVFGAGPHATKRMRELAEGLLRRLDPALQGLARLFPAAQLVQRTRARALPSVPAPVELTPPGGPGIAVSGSGPAPGEGVQQQAAPAGEAPGQETLDGPPSAVADSVTAASDGRTLDQTVLGERATDEAPRAAESADPVTSQDGAPVAAVAAVAAVAGVEATVPPQRESSESVSRSVPYPPVADGPGPAAEDRSPQGAPAPAPSAGPPSAQTPGSASPVPQMPLVRLVSAPLAFAGPEAPQPDRTSSSAAPTTGLPQPGAVAPPNASAATAVTPGAAPAPRAGVRPHVQQVPSPAACAVPPSKGIAREREWLRTAFRQQYNDSAGAIARLLSQSPGLRGTAQSSTEDVITDLVAASLYLRGDGELLNREVRNATVGPHVPLARCVSAGLRRLPSYRGATMLRATLDDAEWAWYGGRRLVTEWAFCRSLTTAASALPGNVDFLIWSMTARRTTLLAPESPSRVLFLPGTSFRVLTVRDGERRAVLLRELSTSEIGPDGQVDTERTPLDEIALSGLDQAYRAWQVADEKSDLDVPAANAGQFTSPPGLISTPGSVTPNAPAASATPGERKTP
ncbi:hypothetical protein ACWEQ3_44765 [Streptomyces mirabilis]